MIHEHFLISTTFHPAFFLLSSSFTLSIFCTQSSIGASFLELWRIREDLQTPQQRNPRSKTIGTGAGTRPGLSEPLSRTNDTTTHFMDPATRCGTAVVLLVD